MTRLREWLCECPSDDASGYASVPPMTLVDYASVPPMTLVVMRVSLR